MRNVQSKYNAADKQEWVRMFRSGMIVRDIADKYHVADSTVFDSLHELGIETNKDIDTGKIKALARAGWSIKDIAGDCSCMEDTVRKVLAIEGRCAIV